MLFILFKSFPSSVLSFVIPMFKFVDDGAIRRISEALDANYRRVSSLFPGRDVATFDTVEIYTKKSIQYT